MEVPGTAPGSNISISYGFSYQSLRYCRKLPMIITAVFKNSRVIVRFAVRLRQKNGNGGIFGGIKQEKEQNVGSGKDRGGRME